MITPDSELDPAVKYAMLSAACLMPPFFLGGTFLVGSTRKEG